MPFGQENLVLSSQKQLGINLQAVFERCHCSRLHVGHAHRACTLGLISILILDSCTHACACTCNYTFLMCSCALVLPHLRKINCGTNEGGGGGMANQQKQETAYSAVVVNDHMYPSPYIILTRKGS